MSQKEDEATKAAKEFKFIKPPIAIKKRKK